MSVVNMYFYEGECEGNFVKSFKSKQKIAAGKAKKVNLWTMRTSHVLRMLPAGKAVKIFIIFDTDAISEIERFTTTVQALARTARKVTLLPQHTNFEDEIAFSCGITPSKKLPKHLYNCSTMRECKERLTNDPNLVNNLSRKGFELSKIWTRSAFQQQIQLNNKNVFWDTSDVIL